MNDTVAFWAGEFGNNYTARNRVNWRARVPFWKLIIDSTHADNVLEVGCNAGWNLRAIHEASPGTKTIGVDVNAAAVREARHLGYDVHNKKAMDIGDLIADVDLVFTAGVLIHVAPEELPATMRAIVQRSSRYVLAVEYEAPSEEEVEYRGHAAKLWKRPYGNLYEHMGLRCIHSWAAGGFDQCTFWLMEKP